MAYIKNFSDKECYHCKSSFKSSKTQQKFCRKQCLKDWWKKNCFKSEYKAKGIPTGTVGTIGELSVAVDLLKRGYNVFRSLSPHCPCDLAILKGSKLFKIEVKTGYLKVDGVSISSPKPLNDNFDIHAVVLTDRIIYTPDLP